MSREPKFTSTKRKNHIPRKSQKLHIQWEEAEGIKPEIFDALLEAVREAGQILRNSKVE